MEVSDREIDQGLARISNNRNFVVFGATKC